jgi:hypothetical protein
VVVVVAVVRGVVQVRSGLRRRRKREEGRIDGVGDKQGWTEVLRLSSRETNDLYLWTHRHLRQCGLCGLHSTIAKSEDVSVTESGNPIAQWQVIEKGLRRWRLSTPLCVTATLSTSPH